MSDEIRKGIAAAARAQDPASDPRYAARIEETLSEEEATKLKALGETSEAHREAWEASEPIGEARRADFAEQITRSLEGQGKAGPAKAESAKAGQVILLFPKKLVAPLLVAVALAAAAAIVFVLPGGPFAPEPMPAYAMIVTGGDRPMRSDPGAPSGQEPIRLGPGSTLDLTLRPATRIQGPIAAEGYLVRGGKARRWDVRAEISAEGAVHIQGERGSLFRNEPAGEVEIALVVGRPGEMPADAEAALRVDSPARWALLRRSVLLVD